MKPLVFDRRRILEITGILAVTTALVAISRLEARLFNLSESLARDHSLLASIFYYAIINLNVFLAILLSLLVIRNIAKLLVERKRGIFGSRLKSKLVGVLMVFSLVPTVLVFYVSTRFITKSFDEWFGGRIKATSQQTRDAGAQIYLQDQKRLEQVAKSIASRVKSTFSISDQSSKLSLDFDGLEFDYGIQSIQVYDVYGQLANKDLSGFRHVDGSTNDEEYVPNFLSKFSLNHQLASSSQVTVENGTDVIRAAVPIKSINQKLLGIVVIEERSDVPVLANIQTILDGLSTLKPGAQLVRVSYLILVTVMTLLIIFAAVWFGFYVAKAITGPLQLLAEATKEVALGNYDVNLKSIADDETGQLTKAFNAMTGDLARQKADVERAQASLEASNREIDKRRRYMEIVFENIASGVIAVDSNGFVTAFNDAAIEMLGLKVVQPMGQKIQMILGERLYEELFALAGGGESPAARELDLREFGVDATVYVAASHIENIFGEFQGTVLVMDDATDRIRMQRATAWREVAKRIAHEIKNPITPIKLSAERLLRRFSNRFEGDDGKVFESCIQAILLQVEVLRNLVNEFSKFSRMPTIQLKTSSLNTIVSSAIEVFRHGYPQVEFKESYGPIPEFKMDPDQVNRVIVNLITNSIDAVSSVARKGSIEIVTRHDQILGAAVIEIRDNGQGIHESIRDRVFEPYFSTKSSGSGLGLAMVNQIVNDHGGYIRIVESSAEGTQFRIEFPLNVQVNV